LDDCANALFDYFELFLKKNGYKAIYEGPHPSYSAWGDIVEIRTMDYNDSGEIVQILTMDKVGEWSFDGIYEKDLPEYEDLPILKQAKEFAKIKWPTFEWPTAWLNTIDSLYKRARVDNNDSDSDSDCNKN